MLRNKNRVIFHRGLFAVIFGKSRSDARGDKIESVPADGIDSFIVKIRQVFGGKPESGPESGTLQG